MSEEIKDVVTGESESPNEATMDFENADNTVLEETARGYEEFIKFIVAEINRVNAYAVSTPYGDVLLSERNEIVNAYKALVETIRERGGEFKSGITGVVKGIKSEQVNN